MLWRKMNSMRMLQTHSPVIFYNPRDTYDVIFFLLILSRPFLTVHTNTIWTRFRFGPLSRAFSNWCASDENTQRISVDRRPKCIEMYAFHENALVWTRLKLWASVRWTSISSRFFHKIVGISGELGAYQELLCELWRNYSNDVNEKISKAKALNVQHTF